MKRDTAMTGYEAIKYAEQHGAILCKYADPTEDAREQISLEEAREIARVDPSLIYLRDEVAVACGCGEWMGERCAWTGAKSETVVVEYMPNHVRSSHRAAGNRGSYPTNGAVRVRVEKSCADSIVESEPEWASVVD